MVLFSRHFRRLIMIPQVPWISILPWTVSITCRIPVVQHRQKYAMCSYCFSCGFIPTRLWKHVDCAAARLCFNFEQFEFPNGRTLYAAHVPSQTRRSISILLASSWKSSLRLEDMSVILACMSRTIWESCCTSRCWALWDPPWPHAGLWPLWPPNCPSPPHGCILWVALRWSAAEVRNNRKRDMNYYYWSSSYVI